MIDVVFLLLVFFMLAARFSVEGAISVPLAGASEQYDGPPRLLEVSQESLFLNGVETDTEAIAASLRRLMSQPDDTIVLRARDSATVQRIVNVMESLAGMGFPAVVLVE